MKKIFIKTFGCQMNEYDSSKILDIMQHDGYMATDMMENADLIILNTCSIREKAEDKVYSDLGRIRNLKQHNPKLLIAVGGCVASQEGQAIINRAPYVDIVFGPQTLQRLPQLIQQKIQTNTPQVDTSFPEIEKFDKLPTPKRSGVSAYVSIMEGCSKYCSYCIVPYTRGEEISRPVADVLNEIHALTSNGAREIHLLGQNVNAYRGILPDGEIADFALLLELINEIDEVLRIRYTTSHPSEMTDRIINCYSKIPKLVSHLHLPVQSGSDRILALMKRGYTVLEYKSIINKLRRIRPNMSISSDFIIGFPTETEKDFLATMALIDYIKYDSSFSFIFSKRPGTPAAKIEDTTPQRVKLDRLQLLQAEINASAIHISKNMIGTIETVLVEGSAKKNDELCGRTDNFKLVNFAGTHNLVGQLVKVKILDNSGSNNLKGEIVH